MEEKEWDTQCLESIQNVVRLGPSETFDSPKFSLDAFKQSMSTKTSKIKELIKNIMHLDSQDMKTHKKKFKHFIFTNSKNGINLVAAGLLTIDGVQFASNKSLSLTEIAKTKDSFGLLTTKKMFNKTVKAAYIKKTLEVFNSRPEGFMRYIVLDSSFKEGIDLYDVKYVHLLEKIHSKADEKQAIGRATRFCGQMGLKFDGKLGWPLHVFEYDNMFDATYKTTVSELIEKNMDVKRDEVTCEDEMVKIVIDNAIDNTYTKNIHEFKVMGGNSKYTYPKVKMENMCEKSDEPFKFTQTQELIMDHLTPASHHKGLLLWSSVGAGKTCTAIATASREFEKQGYTILWVTKSSLKNDIWKNMFGDMNCHVGLQGKTFTDMQKKRPMAQLEKEWIMPLSYKQFGNMLQKKNAFYKKLVARNGESDPLFKTFLVIDEAHKLYTPGALSGNERPDMSIFESMTKKSFETSGRDSVKMLIMSGTFFTGDPMNFIQTLNLILPERLPTKFADFKERFLDIDGKFTITGSKVFKSWIKYKISYLDRSKDARYFANVQEKKIHIAHPAETESFRRQLTSIKSSLTQGKRSIKKFKIIIKVMHNVNVKEKAEIKECNKAPDCIAIAKSKYKDLYNNTLKDIIKDTEFANIDFANVNLDEFLEDLEDNQELLEEMKKDLEQQIQTALDRLEEIAKEVSKLKEKTPSPKTKEEINELMEEKKNVKDGLSTGFTYSKILRQKCYGFTDAAKEARKKAKQKPPTPPPPPSPPRQQRRPSPPPARPPPQRPQPARPQDPESIVNLRKEYLRVFDRIGEVMLTKKQILLNFHPDKLPAVVKEMMKGEDKTASIFVSRMFSELSSKKTLTRAELASSILKPSMIGGRKKKVQCKRI